MRRVLILIGLLALVLVGADQVARAIVESRLEDRAQSLLSAGAVDAQIRAAVVLPDLVRGRLGRLDLHAEDAALGDPAVRLATVDATAHGVELPFPPPDPLERVAVEHGTFRLSIHDRELQRLLRDERPGWDVAASDRGIVATGTVQGAPVEVVADVIVDGGDLLFVARDVDAGSLGAGAARVVAAAFDLRFDLPALPGGFVLTAATARPGSLELTGRIEGDLQLAVRTVYTAGNVRTDAAAPRSRSER